jgi:glyoxylase-like metal-dependent hydrolase (beta-lactamase superfamily II)
LKTGRSRLEEQAHALANWVVASGKNLTTICAPHGHGDHFFGTITVLERFPGARFVALPDVIKNFEKPPRKEFAIGLRLCIEEWRRRDPKHG